MLVLRFHQWYSFGEGDKGVVQIATGLSNDWETITSPTQEGGSSSGWEPAIMELTPYSGQQIRLGFLHDTNADIYVGEGWSIDAVELSHFVPDQLLLGQDANDVLLTDGEKHYYVVDSPSGGHLLITLDDWDDLGINELYVRHAALPSAGEYDYRFSNQGGADQEIFVPSAAAGSWYIMVYGESVPPSGQYTIKADFSTGTIIRSISPQQHGNNMPVSISIEGAGFSSTTEVSLVQGETVYEPNEVLFVSGSNLIADFDLTVIPAGSYQLRAGLDGDWDNIPFEVLDGGMAQFETDLIIPDRLGYHSRDTLYIEYRNEGDVAMPAPLLVLTAAQNGNEGALLTLDHSLLLKGFWTSAVPEDFRNSIQILAHGETPGILQPGESIKVPVYWAGWQKPWDFSYPPFDFSLGVLDSNDDRIVDWNAMKNDMRPEGMNDQVWDALWTNFLSQTGQTWGDYVSMLTDNAVYLNQLGIKVTDIGELLAFEFSQADAINVVRTLSSATDAHVSSPGLDISFSRVYPQNITSRYTFGDMGYGWSHNWDYWLEFATDGTIKMHTPGGGLRIYQPDRRFGRPYFTKKGDHAVFQEVTGGYSHMETNGLLRVFAEDGKLDYIEDTNGNRLTCTYNGDLLIRIEYSNGRYLDLTYNVNSLLDTVSDPDGRTTTYNYDLTDEHLETVTYFNGKAVIYDYIIDPNVVKNHALTTITYPGGSHQYFDYDSRGRLSSMYKDNQEEKFDFTYDSTGMITTACSCSPGEFSKYYLDNNGMLAKSINPLGEEVSLKYDGDYNLASVTDPAGYSYNYTYDDKGNLIQITDPLGNNTRFGYQEVYNRLTSLIDVKSNITKYTYDNLGNLESIIYEDDSVENWSYYDESGNPATWTSRRGTPVNYVYDPNSGAITAKIYQDSSRVDYIYDNRGNLISAMDINGTTTFDYDTDDQLTRITYPGNRWLDYTYNDAGQRESMTNQLGHTLNYHYDDIGRLERITDESAAEIVHYYYDPAGRLEKKVLANGVYTLYSYDPAGQLLSLYNHKSDDTILSGFDYTYDSRGRRISMITTYGDPVDFRNDYEGTWLYEYDNLGQLTAWTDPNDRRVDYVYDALGNRITETDESVVTAYTTNKMNQYTQVGNVTYVYDSDGNMTQKITSEGTTIYTYSDENKLIAVSSPEGNWLYTYDTMGNRIRVDDNGTVTDYIIDLTGFGNVVGEYDNPTGQLLRTYDHGFGLLSQNSVTGGKYYYTFDAIGNAQELTNPAQQILNNYIYEPFGKDILSNEVINNPFKFVGQFGVMKETNGLDFMRARFYESALGKFASQDPVGIKGGLNLYNYCQNNPTEMIDPVGLERWQWQPMYYRPGSWSDVFQEYNEIQNWRAKQYQQHSEKGYDNIKTALHEAAGTSGFDMLSFVISLGTSKYFREGMYHEINASGHLIGQAVGIVADWATAMYYGFKPKGQEYAWASPIPPISGSNSGSSGNAGSIDPNKKSGPKGSSEKNYVSISKILPYQIEFENEPNATAPAQIVTITDQLESNLDLSTFELTEIGFGDYLIEIPEGTQHFEWTEPMTYNGIEFEVQIEAGIHLTTGEVYANFYSVEPLSGLPPTVDIGFLPPEDGTGRGMGYINYVIKCQPDVPTDTEIRNIAYITFDFAETIATNQIDPHDPSAGTDPNSEALCTIDSGGPNSHVLTLPPSISSPFTLELSGQDDASGVEDYEVYKSVNGNPFSLWRTSLENSLVFYGREGDTYSFYSLAKDNVGNTEEIPFQADASTTVIDIVPDLNTDGIINIEDLVWFAVQWLQIDCSDENVWCQGSDFNQDQTVNLKEFAEVAEKWLQAVSQ